MLREGLADDRGLRGLRLRMARLAGSSSLAAIWRFDSSRPVLLPTGISPATALHPQTLAGPGMKGTALPVGQRKRRAPLATPIKLRATSSANGFTRLQVIRHPGKRAAAPGKTRGLRWFAGL